VAGVFTVRPIRLMVRPLPDGAAHPLGAPLPAGTFNGALSRDGRRIAISRGTQRSDVVLISAVPARKP
jgi:hypothetical protein